MMQYPKLQGMTFIALMLMNAPRGACRFVPVVALEDLGQPGGHGLLFVVAPVVHAVLDWMKGPNLEDG